MPHFANAVFILIFITIPTLNALSLAPSHCEDKQGNKYEIGETVHTDNTCGECTCENQGAVVCTIVHCSPCNGKVIPVEGQCCGKCLVGHIQIIPGTGCMDNGTSIVYGFGDTIPMDDPCKSCHCDGTDGGNVVCTIVACNTCQGTHIPVEGSCCGDCISPTTQSVSGCEKDGVQFEFGETVNTENHCETCQCSTTGVIVCTMMECPPCSGKEILVEGQCCGDCFVGDVQIIPGTGCMKNGTEYGFGDALPTDDPCLTCYCADTNGGDVMCTSAMCEYCPGQHVPVEGSCCGECHDVTVQAASGCERNGFIYKDGPVGDLCDGCVCEDGVITCVARACPELTCVDPEPGDDCCLHCPNGTTCFAGKTVIKKDEYKEVGNKYCTCSGDPWYPNAFCTLKKVNPSFIKTYGEYLADYDTPGV